jgi:hypothetical protein
MRRGRRTPPNQLQARLFPKRRPPHGVSGFKSLSMDASGGRTLRGLPTAPAGAPREPGPSPRRSRLLSAYSSAPQRQAGSPPTGICPTRRTRNANHLDGPARPELRHCRAAAVPLRLADHGWPQMGARTILRTWTGRVPTARSGRLRGDLTPTSPTCVQRARTWPNRATLTSSRIATMAGSTHHAGTAVRATRT